MNRSDNKKFSFYSVVLFQPICDAELGLENCVMWNCYGLEELMKTVGGGLLH